MHAAKRSRASFTSSGRSAVTLTASKREPSGVQQGFVELIANPRHKRSQLVRVTRKGRANFDAMTKRFLAAEEKFVPHFGAGEVSITTDVLKRAKGLLAV